MVSISQLCNRKDLQMIGRVSTMDALTIFAAVLIVGGAWRLAAVRLHDKPLGQAMAFLY